MWKYHYVDYEFKHSVGRNCQFKTLKFTLFFVHLHDNTGNFPGNNQLFLQEPCLPWWVSFRVLFECADVQFFSSIIESIPSSTVCLALSQSWINFLDSIYVMFWKKILNFYSRRDFGHDLRVPHRSLWMPQTSSVLAKFTCLVFNPHINQLCTYQGVLPPASFQGLTSMSFLRKQLLDGVWPRM